MGMNGYLIPEGNIGKFTARFTKLQRKAARLGVAEPSLAHLPYTVKVSRAQRRFTRTTTYAPVLVSGAAPVINGWEFAATIDSVALADGSKSALYRVAPGFDGAAIPARYRESSPNTCEHCNVKRYRKASYIVHSRETDEWRQVGRQCIKDFCGWHKSPDAIAKHNELFYELAAAACSGSDEWGMVPEKSADVAEFLKVVIAAARVWGYVSRKQAIDSPTTGDRAWEVLTGTTDGLGEPARSQYAEHLAYIREKIDAAVDATPGIFDRVDDCIQWAKGLPGRSEYERNLSVAVQLAAVGRRQVGLLASAYQAYERARGSSEAPAPASTWVGEVKQRLDLDVKVEAVIGMEPTQWSADPVLYKFCTADGNKLAWFSSKSIGIERGETLKVKATVKKHDEFRGVKQTTVTRVKVIQ